MKRVYGNCCGIDVHKKMIVACFIHGKKQEIREFGTTTKELTSLAEWLKVGQCEMAAMESTGVYWKPLYNIFEVYDIKTIIVNAQHMKAVPGRKTDVKDSEWIADLLQHGLLRASYIPDKNQRELREMVQYRKSLADTHAAELNRLQKILEGGNIKLSGTVSEIDGKSARNIIRELLLNQKIDEQRIKEMKNQKLLSSHLKATDKELADSLEGVLSKIQIRIISEILNHLDELEKHINNLTDDIDSSMNSDEKKAKNAIKEIPGIGDKSADAIIAVIGTDMERFPDASHISSWAGVSPGNNESAKKRRNQKTNKGNKLLKSTLVVCANSAIKCKNSFFYAQYQRIMSRRGKKKAIMAIAHSMLIAIYHILKDKVPFRDLGANYYNQFNRERKAFALTKKLVSLGYCVSVTAMTDPIA